MLFWICLDLFLIVLFFITTLLIPDKHKRWIALSVMILLTLISAFRYGTGVDYFSYESLYYEDVTYKEPLFDFIIGILKYLGFSAQMMFLVYAVLTSFFIWKGISGYFSKPQQILFAVILYGAIDTLWMFSMNGMRQGLATAIFFWSVQFLLKGERKKYICSSFFMLLNHFASVITLISPILIRIKLKRLAHLSFILLILFIVKFLDIPSIIIAALIIFDEYLGFGTQYLLYVSDIWMQESIIREGGTGLGILFSVCMYFFILYFLNTKRRFDNFICNMLTMSIAIKSIFWFSQPLLRLRGFFEIFYIIGIILIVEKFEKNNRIFLSVLFILFYSIMKLNYLNGLSSTFDINYIMNFRLRD